MKSQKIAVDQKTSLHIVRRFEPLQSPVSGGYFYADHYTSGKWVLAISGNGVILCIQINPNSFPAGAIPKCCDEETNETKTRFAGGEKPTRE